MYQNSWYETVTFEDLSLFITMEFVQSSCWWLCSPLSMRTYLSLNHSVWGWRGVILCRHPVKYVVILTFNDLINVSVFFSWGLNCHNLDKSMTNYGLENLNPYTYYKVTLLAYVCGKVRRNGTAEKCIFQTEASRKWHAFMLLSLNGKEQSMTILTYGTSVYASFGK